MITYIENKNNSIYNSNNNSSNKKKLFKNLVILFFLFTLLNSILLKKIDFNFNHNNNQFKKHYKSNNQNINNNNNIIDSSINTDNSNNMNNMNNNNNNNLINKKIYWPSVFIDRDNNNEILPIEWNKCVLRNLGIDAGTKSIGYANIELDKENGKLILSPTENQNYDKDIYSGISSGDKDGSGHILKKLKQKVIIAHAKSCPFHELEISNSILHKDLQIEKQLYPPVKVGVAVLVEDIDNQRILITKRSEKLRIFPSVWVLPGGHMEQNESIFETGLRELEEEVGISKSDLDLNSLQVIGIFESSYPILLPHDKLPGDHHIVIFINVKLKSNNDSNSIIPTINLKLQEEEVQLGAWISKSILSKILDGTSTEYDLFNQKNNINNNNHNYNNINIEQSVEIVYPIYKNQNNNQEKSKITSDQLIDKLIKGTDYIATGTIYILKQYLNNN